MVSLISYSFQVSKRLIEVVSLFLTPTIFDDELKISDSVDFDQP